MNERKLISARCGVINPLSIADYIASGGYESFKKAMASDRISVLDEIAASKLRGRGGAGFPCATKLVALAKEEGPVKYVVCNADEGEPGNFKDRYLMENNPHQILEGLLIAAYVTRSTQGYVYVRGEYDHAIEVLDWAIREARRMGFLGSSVCGSAFCFDIELKSGAGSYVCGEEFALLESIEGKPGRTRVKPPFPTSKGLFGKPTLIQNVETLSNLPVILEIGAKAFSQIGMPNCTGTKLISLSGNVRHKGVFEIPFGVSIRDVIDELGGGVEGGRKLKMVQLGGACGPFIPDYMLDMLIDYERFEEFESKTGAGAIIVVDERFDLFDLLIRINKFFEHESCGKCTPCREGHTQLLILLERFRTKQATTKDLISLESLARVMHQTALCGLGQTSPTAIISTLRYFRDDYIERCGVWSA